jgi:hypothetical protein
MRRLIALASLLPALSLTGCIAYPKIYWNTKKGYAHVEEGKPIIIKATLIKTCDTESGSTQKEIRTRQTKTGPDGHYKLTMWGIAWNSKSFITEAGCDSYIQMFLCREVCKPADDVDIEVLGK